MNKLYLDIETLSAGEMGEILKDIHSRNLRVN